MKKMQSKILLTVHILSITVCISAAGDDASALASIRPASPREIVDWFDGLEKGSYDTAILQMLRRPDVPCSEIDYALEWGAGVRYYTQGEAVGIFKKLDEPERSKKLIMLFSVLRLTSGIGFVRDTGTPIARLLNITRALGINDEVRHAFFDPNSASAISNVWGTSMSLFDFILDYYPGPLPVEQLSVFFPADKHEENQQHMLRVLNGSTRLPYGIVELCKRINFNRWQDVEPHTLSRNKDLQTYAQQAHAAKPERADS